MTPAERVDAPPAANARSGPMPILNLGILAHVDAGKTTLTERLLYATGVISEVGSVDQGSTQTDSLALERQRGITIKSAVVSFVIDGVRVNLIDTPGHPDFIAEVERVLTVLDGAVLVISAVEGVQPQTRILMRTLRRLSIPTLIFINKIDRRGARCEEVVEEIGRKLTPSIIAMGSTRDLGSRAASFEPFDRDDTRFLTELAERVADRDPDVLTAYVDDDAGRLRASSSLALAAQTRDVALHPVFFGSAITGAGVDRLMEAITELLPSAEGSSEGPASGIVFKVERGPGGEKIALVRVFSGCLRSRERVALGPDRESKVTAIRAFDRGSTVETLALGAGEIGQVWGLAEAEIGDTIGVPPARLSTRQFAPPTLETAIVPRNGADKGALHVVLSQLAEQDPLINLRQDDIRGEMYLSLYGEVQKQVIQETLALEFGIDVEFRETTPICVERPVGVASAVELLGGSNPFLATIGYRIEPADTDSGVRVKVDAKLEGIPLHVFKTLEEFGDSIHSAVVATLGQGLHGWAVTDCVVTMTESDYISPGTTAADYRLLTPLVVMDALAKAGTAVCEPADRFRIELPAEAMGAVLSALARLGAVPEEPQVAASSCVLHGRIAAARVHELQQELPGLTHGEGVLEYAFCGYEPVRGHIPSRPRTDRNPLNRKEYLRHVRGI